MPYDDPDVSRLQDKHFEWRAVEEEKILNEYGEAGFELVTYIFERASSGYRVRAVFKAPKVGTEAVAPRIGFAHIDPEA